MELKNFLLITILASSLWALFISGMILIEDLGNIPVEGELPEQRLTNFTPAPVGDKFASMVNVLNLGLPAGFSSLALLLITYRNNPVGLSALVAVTAILFLASVKTMDATLVVESMTDFSFAARVWWM